MTDWALSKATKNEGQITLVAEDIKNRAIHSLIA
jgi:hypothetical protein